METTPVIFSATSIFPVAAGVRSTKAKQNTRWLTYLRGGAQWRGKAGLFTPSLSGWASHPHAQRGYCGDAGGCSHACLLPPSFCLDPLLLLLRLYLLHKPSGEGAVCHLRGGTGWVTYQLWCQAHMAGTSLAGAITWEPLIDMRPHSQRLPPLLPLSPRGEGLAICHWAERKKGNKREMVRIKMLLLAAIFVKNGVNLIYWV